MNNRLHHNPYDYLRPVTDRAMFAGREKELSDIAYYLDEARTSPHPAHIAILGPRAAGKTSLLNVIEQEAQDRGYCTARLNLDEDDARNQQAFFFKLFDAVVMAAFELGAYGGTFGTTYSVYADMVYAYEIPASNEFKTFLFPLQYAKARASGKLDTEVSEPSIRRDLIEIHSQVDRPIVVLIDEGNVLARNRVLLQKMRNLFMNIPGYALVITGTPELFAVIDDVFSPIVRGFHKISIDAFEDRRDTKDCINKPLLSLGIRPEDAFEARTMFDVWQIHNVSGGRPYEIQMICHEMFRRYQRNPENRMKLDFAVLEEVRKQLEDSRDISTRPILRVVQDMAPRQLDALRILVRGNGQATLDQLWATEYAFSGDTEWTIDSLKRSLEALTSDRVLSVDESGKVSFNGDDFDKLYTKYFAREQGIETALPGGRLDSYWYSTITERITERVIGRLTPDSEDDSRQVLKGLSSVAFSTLSKVKLESVCSDLVNGTTRKFTSNVGEVYTQMWKAQEGGTIKIVSASVRFPWLNLDISIHEGSDHFFSDGEVALDVSSEPANDETSFDRVVEVAVLELQSLAVRVAHCNGEMKIDLVESEVPPRAALAQALRGMPDGHLKSALARFHAQMVREIYERAVKGNTEYESGLRNALQHARLSLEASNDLQSNEMNDIGYIYLRVGECREANAILQQAAAQSHREAALNEVDGMPGEDAYHSFTSALISYNESIALAQLGELEQACKGLASAATQLLDVRGTEESCLCLIVPSEQAGGVGFAEEFDIYLSEAIRTAQRLLCFTPTSVESRDNE